MTRNECMGFVDAWLRSGQTSSREYAACIGLDLDAFRSWIIDYGRPSTLIPVRVMAGCGESLIRAIADEGIHYLPRSAHTASGSEYRLIPVVIQERS